MPTPMRSGRARISAHRPRAIGCCDRCGLWVNHHALSRQEQWGGNALIDTGLLVCDRCLDVPQQQFRNPILPPDPWPILNARTDPTTTPVTAAIGFPLPTSPENQGFSVYTLGLVLVNGQIPVPGPPAPIPTPAPTPPPGPTPTPTPTPTQPSLDFSKPENSQYLGMI